MEENQPVIAADLFVTRNSMKVTRQIEIAERLNIAVETYSDIERGKIGVDVETYNRIVQTINAIAAERGVTAA